MYKIELPFWLNGKHLQKLKAAAQNYWEKIETWASWVLGQRDAETCTEGVLELLAYERDIERLPNEPLYIYRLRVKHALVNAKDAGSTAGIKRIFQRLGIGYVNVIEREPGQDWDVISLELSDGQLSTNQELLQALLVKYGRTCRRYQFKLLAPTQLGVAGKEFGHTYFYDKAS